MAEAHSIKGSNFKSLLKYVADMHGADAPDKVIAQLSPEDQTLFKNVIYDGAWLPERVYADLSYATDKVFGRGDYSLCFDIGKYNALNCVPKFYWLFIRMGSPAFVLKSASNFWRQTHSSGSLVIHEITSNSAIIHLNDYYRGNHINPSFCHGLRGYMSGVLELSGAKDVQMKEVQCGALGASHCIFNCIWK